MEDEKDTYNEKVSKIEKEIVEYLVNSPLYSTRNKFTTRILIYIILSTESPKKSYWIFIWENLARIK